MEATDSREGRGRGEEEEAEGAAVIGRLLHDFGAENIGGHQIGRELDALFGEAENGAHGFDELGFGEARDADNQGVAAGEDRGQRVVEDGFLTENDVREGVVRLFQGFGGGLGLSDDGVVRGRSRKAHRSSFRCRGSGPPGENTAANANWFTVLRFRGESKAGADAYSGT